MTERPTLRTIAEMLDISPATVSKALSGRPEVNEHTRAQVVFSAKKLGYSQNKDMPGTNGFKGTAARGAIIIEDQEKKEDRNAFFYDVLIGFNGYATKINLETIVLPIDDAWRRDPDIYDECLGSKRIDCVFVPGVRKGDPWISRLYATRIPTVVLDYSIDNPLVGRIGVDNITGARLAVDHLVSLGHRKIGFLNGHSQAEVSEERLTGFAAAMYRNHLPFSPELVFEGDFSEQSGAAAADYFAKMAVTAVFCASDLMAIGLIHELQALGIPIPEALSVVGFDNMTFTGFCTPKLTTIGQDRDRLGVMACALLHELMNGGPLNNCVLHPSLVLRESTAPAKTTFI